ncbi:nucleolar protein 8-like isoform X2 [Frieseomelitta varia]|uniref:nucleolar protein 8-like isoform X2 n=1 Tax=Frieseomelitta varia TaxID=561572 RepID=UPI001CB68A22|nr:nucleolar protein 8-like isoform X2 [Frieseomelitta varia]
MNGIDISEKKRLESLKRKKQIFRAKELAVQNALKNLDNNRNKNKIIFDDNDINDIEQFQTKEKRKKKNRDLFDDADDDKNDNEPVWDNHKFDSNKNFTEKYLGNNITDERFKLDKRFMDDDQETNKDINVNDNEIDLQKEKELQLDILENILGVPITSKNKDINKNVKFSKKGMIRYDPTENDHKEYEINTEKCEIETKNAKKKKKNKRNIEDPIENPPVEVSKDIYFSVSDSLLKSLNEGGQFSLLKTYGRDITNENNNNSNVSNVETPKIQLNFDSKKSFKYDSSEDEHDSKQEYTNNEKSTPDIIVNTNKFFFDSNDIRFKEAENFFSKEHVPTDTFKELRQKVKQIVHSKIRKNMKKKQHWGYKKKIKKSS